MNKITKYLLNMMIIVIMVLDISLGLYGTTRVMAAENMTYKTEAHMINKFKKKGNRLIVKVDDTFSNKKWKKTNVNSISYKLSNKCKWLDRNIDYFLGYGPKYYKTSFKQVKQIIEAQRIWNKPGGDINSPVGITIVVKKKKIVKIITAGS